MSSFGNKIHNRRKELGLTLDQVGAFCGVSKATVSKWEKGVITDVRRDKIERIAVVLRLNPMSLVRDDVDAQPLDADDRITEVPLSPNKKERAMMRAYRLAPDNIRALIDLALAPYIEE